MNQPAIQQPACQAGKKTHQPNGILSEKPFGACFQSFLIALAFALPLVFTVVFSLLVLPAVSLAKGLEGASPQSLAPAGIAQPVEAQLDLQSPQAERFEAGVKAYRAGDYRQAHHCFEAVHHSEPENVKATYYLAITEAQLGRFQQAKTLYEEIIALAPQGEPARLASLGLKYLPKEPALDLPPRFQGQDSLQTSADASAVVGNAQPAQPMGAPATGNPQDWMLWQAMMGQLGGGNQGNGFNPMGGMMMPQPGGVNAPGGNGYDPSVLSNMMMNQMMQSFTLGGDKDENR